MPVTARNVTPKETPAPEPPVDEPDDGDDDEEEGEEPALASPTSNDVGKQTKTKADK